MSRRNKLLLCLLFAWFIPALSTAIMQPVGIIRDILSTAVMTVFSDTFDISTPAGDDSPTQADDRMREIKAAVQEREDVDHYWPLLDSDETTEGNEVASAFTGEHRKITFFVGIENPDQVDGKAHLYFRQDELYYQSDSDTMRMTDNGNLFAQADLLVTDDATIGDDMLVSGDLDVAGFFDPSFFLSGAAGGRGGFIDEDDMSTNAATKAPSQQSVKRYVDDSIETANIGGVEEFDTVSIVLTTSYVTKDSFTQTFNDEKDILFIISGGYDCDNSQTITIQLTDGVFDKEWTFGGNDSGSTIANRLAFSLTTVVPRSSVTGASQTFDINAKASGTAGGGCRLGNVGMLYIQAE